MISRGKYVTYNLAEFHEIYIECNITPANSLMDRRPCGRQQNCATPCRLRETNLVVAAWALQRQVRQNQIGRCHARHHFLEVEPLPVSISERRRKNDLRAAGRSRSRNYLCFLTIVRI